MPKSSRYTDWERCFPIEDRRDPLWHIEAYRLARYVVLPCWDDIRAIGRAPYGAPIANQLWRAASAIAPDISEGYSRSSIPDRLRLLEYALGSTRESLDHYRTAGLILPQRDVAEPMTVLRSTRNLLLTMIAGQRAMLPRKPHFGG